MESEFRFLWVPRNCIIWTWRAGPIVVCPGIAAWILECASARKCACDEVFCLHPPSRVCTWLPHPFCKESVTFTLFTTCDLAIGDLATGDLAVGCLGVRAIESLDVRVATIVVRDVRKNVATSKFSDFWLIHSNSARNASSNGPCFILSFFWRKEFCRSCLKSFRDLIGPA